MLSIFAQTSLVTAERSHGYKLTAITGDFVSTIKR